MARDVLTEVVGHVGIARINRPAGFNALNRAPWSYRWQVHSQPSMWKTQTA